MPGEYNGRPRHGVLKKVPQSWNVVAISRYQQTRSRVPFAEGHGIRPRISVVQKSAGKIWSPSRDAMCSEKMVSCLKLSLPP
jgi:hypothetical protein